MGVNVAHVAACCHPLPLFSQAHVACSLGGGGTAPHVATMSMMHPGTGNAVTTSARGGGGGMQKGSVDDEGKDDNNRDELDSSSGDAAGNEESTPLKCKG